MQGDFDGRSFPSYTCLKIAEISGNRCSLVFIADVKKERGLLWRDLKECKQK